MRFMRRRPVGLIGRPLARRVRRRRRRPCIILAPGKQAFRIFTAVKAPVYTAGLIGAQRFSALDAAGYDLLAMLLAESGIRGSQRFLCGNIPNLLLLARQRRLSASHICTAFSAAPLRRLSLTIHRFSAISQEISPRILPTKVASFPSASTAMG